MEKRYRNKIIIIIKQLSESLDIQISEMVIEEGRILPVQQS